MTQSDQIDELHSDMKKLMTEEIPLIRDRLTRIETAHSVWGAVAGFVSGIVASIVSGVALALFKTKL